MNLLSHLFVLASIYALLATSLNLVAGVGGMISLAHAAFYGIGAYSAALLTTQLGWTFLPSAGIGIVLASATAIVLGWITLRLRQEMFVIATFAFQLIVGNIMLNWTKLTNGPLGVTGVPRPVLLGLRIGSVTEYAVLAAVVLLLTLLFVSSLVHSPFGRVLKVIREDEQLARSRGQEVEYTKIASFAISAAIAAIAGGLYAAYYSYIDPASFTMSESILVLAMMIIGGAGNLWGPVLGASLLVLLPEALRFLGFPADVASHLRHVIYGVALAALMLWRPGGLIGDRAFVGSQRK
jgi:branched-chain amino acid transport system permease protein